MAARPVSRTFKNYLHMITRPSGLERYFAFNYPPYHMRSALLRQEWMLPAECGFAAQLLPPGIGDTLSRVMYFESAANLVGDMLVKVDRMSMAASLEVRCPLLDHELAELTPPSRTREDCQRPRQNIIDALGDLPPELYRPKWGFVPLADWFRVARVSSSGITSPTRPS
jgi:asparagine synthase (glutamine-hydrolysing)